MTVVLAVLGFAIGSIPFGVIIARRMGIDIKAHGSGNIGATNVTRVLGVIPGLVVLVLDATKGALPVAIALQWSAAPWTIALTGLSAILGHCFSPALGGKGGKGVATALGVFLVLCPSYVVVALGAFSVLFNATRIPALGSLAGMVALSVMLLVFGTTPYATLACVTTLLLVYTHRSNLANLRAK